LRVAARYELHPERRDVFVEGERDQGLIRAFLENEEKNDVSVFSISVVNIAAHLVLEKSLPHPSRRSEVITLALELEAREIPSRQAVCVADADSEYLLPTGLACPLLLLTDFTSMELYAFTQETVHRVLLVVSPNTGTSGSELLADFVGPLQFLFSARAANCDLKFGLSWIENIDKFFSVQDDRVQFDEKEFMKRYLVDRLAEAMVAAFQIRLQQIQALLSSDVRCRIRGHDFVKLLTWYLRKPENCRHLNEDSVRQMLYVTLQPDQLAGHPMFSSLLKRITS
jgi:hypothetical protein